jgi:hypothetical protein
MNAGAFPAAKWRVGWFEFLARLKPRPLQSKNVSAFVST